MIDPDLYPVPQPGYSLHLSASESTLFHVEKADAEAGDRLGFRTYDQWKLHPQVARYLAACDGRATHGEIGERLGGGLNSLIGPLLAEQAAQALAPSRVLAFRTRPARSTGWRVTGGLDSFAPLHISFEITDTCNFRCDHCYVSASPEKHGRKNGRDTMEQLDRLADAGVVIVELTGGECTTHPEFREILAHAAARFHIVGIISNGYLLGKRPDLARFVASFPNVIVQISLDGMRDFHDRFRHMPGSFDAACAAIRMLKQGGTFVRIGVTATDANLDQIEDLFFLAKELEADALGVAAASSFGRGAELVQCGETERQIGARLDAILRPHADDPLFDALRREREGLKADKSINCGAGWRSFALNQDGTVRSCLFLADSKKFGNIDSEDYGEVFRRPEMRLFHDAPSPGTAECLGGQPDGGDGPCRHLGECIGCFAKAFRVTETVYPECPWRARYFPGMTLAASSDAIALAPAGKGCGSACASGGCGARH